MGAADGGPGLPFLGWSTEAGDLRVSHFFGLHALQVLPLLVVLLRLFVTRFDARIGALTGVAVGYGSLIIFTYVQALMGQSIVSPITGVALVAILTIGIVFGFITHKYVGNKSRPTLVSEQSRL